MLRYGTLEYLWISSFARANEYVMVGDGNENSGVIINGEVITWDRYAEIGNSLKIFHKVYFLNCDSNSLKDSVNFKEDNSFTFSGKIDATSAALIVNLDISISRGISTIAFDIINKLVKRVETIKSNGINPEQILYFSTIEKLGTAAYGAMYVVLAFLDVALHHSIYSPWVDLFLLSIMVPLSVMHYYLLGGETWEAFEHAWDSLKVLAENGLADFLLNQLSWLDALAAVTMLGVLIALIALLGGMSQFAVWTLLVVSMANWVYWWIVDSSDCDDDFHQTNSCNPAPPGGYR